jgi:hypothetical protein
MGTQDTTTKTTIFCPFCNGQHIDEGKYSIKPHRIHLCFHCSKKFKVSKATIGIRDGSNLD